MTPTRMPPKAVGAAWLVLGALFFGGIGCWSATVGGNLDHPEHVRAAPSPPPVRAIPAVVTEYPGQAYLTAAELCAKVAPDFNAVIVDNTTGFVVANIHC